MNNICIKKKKKKILKFNPYVQTAKKSHNTHRRTH